MKIRIRNSFISDNCEEMKKQVTETVRRLIEQQIKADEQKTE